MLAYTDFLQSKQIISAPSGFEPSSINSKLFDFQSDIDRFALRRGTAGVFTDCGSGKSAIQLEYAHQVSQHTGGDVLVLAPLGVTAQTAREAKKFGIEAHVARHQEEARPGITITNYEMLQHFNPSRFIGVVLDESSILKSYMGKTKTALCAAFRDTPYKLACSATPAPNDHMELLNQAAFLDVMQSHEALSIWFINDSMRSGHYRLKNHAIRPFWEWVCSWAVCMSNPSDLGYDGHDFVLPKLNQIEHIIDVDLIDPSCENGFIRKIDMNATSFHKEKRNTIFKRAEKSAEIAEKCDGQVLIWCDTNYEADALMQVLPEAVEVRGSDSPAYKEKMAIEFADGNIQHLISKPGIFGYGMNFQQCHNTIHCGLSYSYEEYYQTLRRFWRYGQKHEVNNHIVLGSTEKHILDTVRRKEEQDAEMHRQLAGVINDIQRQSLRGRQFLMEEMNTPVQLPAWLRDAV